MSRAARELIRRATAGGWSVARTRGGHLRFTHPEASVPVFTASTPSDHRALANALATMRRALAPDPDLEPKRKPANAEAAQARNR